jgi:hypothetical protein
MWEGYWSCIGSYVARLCGMWLSAFRQRLVCVHALACSYCRSLPASYTRQDVGEMFLPFGTVLEIRL